MKRPWHSLMGEDEFTGSNGCQICGGRGETIRLAYGAGLFTLCAEHRLLFDLALIETDAFMNSETAYARLRAFEICGHAAVTDFTCLDVEATVLAMRAAALDLFKAAVEIITFLRGDIEEGRAAEAIADPVGDDLIDPIDDVDGGGDTGSEVQTGPGPEPTPAGEVRTIVLGEGRRRIIPLLMQCGFVATSAGSRGVVDAGGAMINGTVIRDLSPFNVETGDILTVAGHEPVRLEVRGDECRELEPPETTTTEPAAE